MKILIIRFSSIGDIVLTTPVIRCISQQLPEAEIHFLTKPQFAILLSSNPYLNKIHLLEKEFADTIKELKAENFDIIIDLHSNLRTFRVKSALKAVSYSFNKLNPEKWLMTNFRWNILPDIHIVDRYMQTASVLQVKNDAAGLDYFIPENSEVDQSVLPAFLHSGFYCIVIGAAHATKKLPVDKVIRIIEQVALPVILIGGKEDRAAGEEICNATGGLAFNACGNFNLHQSASIVRQSRLVLSNDTGFMHIAAALKKKVIAAWGNTIPEFGMYPYYGDLKIDTVNFEIKNLPCRPCSKIGYSKCPKKHFKCMREQDTDAIASKVLEFWRLTETHG